MKIRLKTFQHCALANAAMLACAAIAQTTAVPAPVTVGASNAATDQAKPSKASNPAVRLQAFREAARRDALLHAAQLAAAAPAIPGAAEKEGAAPAAGEVSRPAKFGEEGIRIHGHWVIDVKNPNGTLAGHHDFQNSLQAGGGFLLGGLLNSEFVPANWMIELNGTTPICGSSSSNICGIVQSQSTQPAASFCAGGSGTCVTGLTTAFNYSTPPTSFTLTGNFIATQAGNINQVATVLGACFTGPGSVFSPQTCAVGAPAGSFGSTFSSTAIAAIPVASGQTVLVTVTFTFS